MKLFLYRCVFLYLCALFHDFSGKLVWEMGKKPKPQNSPNLPLTENKCISKCNAHES